MNNRAQGVPANSGGNDHLSRRFGVRTCCRQQQVVAALMSQPGFHLSSIDYLLGDDMPAAAAAASSDQDDDSFSFVACMLL